MAIHPHPQSQSSSFSLDALYCEETEQWEEHEGEGEVVERESEFPERESFNTTQHAIKLPSLVLLDLDLVWEDEELVSLFSKEQQCLCFFDQISDPCSLIARKEAVDWILKVKAHYGFSALTAILAINYLDRFLSSLHFQKDKPWMIQLVAVTCLSLAAKVEETQVPLLLDLQVEDTKYLFEAKNIQKMELLVMSTLEWRMNPVTPISFLDHIIRRQGLRTHLHWEFFKRCEALILSLVSDSRFVRYLPSVLATATMLHVIDQVETSNPIDYQNQLLGVLKTTKEKVKECYELIVEEESSTLKEKNGVKRKYEDNDEETCSSPSGVMDAYESSNDSWALGPTVCSSSSSSSSPHRYHHHHHHHHNDQLLKKMRLVVVQEQAVGLGSSLSSNSRALLDVIGSPH